MVLNVRSCVLVTGSENDTFPPSQSRWTLIRRSLSLMGKRTASCSGDCDKYSFPVYCTYQTPSLKKASPFLWYDSVIIPTVQAELFPTSTSQQCAPDLNPSEPKTQWKKSNLSGLSGSGRLLLLYVRLVRSSDSTSCGLAVFGSRTTGADERKQSAAALIQILTELSRVEP